MGDLESTVWMIHARTSRDGVKGTLTLGSEGLVFRPRSGGADTVFPLHGIKRVHRAMASPVLELKLAIPGGPPVVGFYFVQPPSLEAQHDSGPFGRRRLRREAAVTLFRWNAVKKAEVGRWVEAIRDASRGS